MPNPAYPFNDIQDSKFFGEMPEDPAVRVEIEGGYEITRPRFTRSPRRVYTSGHTMLTNAQKLTLSAFWDTVKGGSVVFDWTHPTTAVVYAVRFTKQVTFKYVGVGGVHYWDCQFEVRTA